MCIGAFSFETYSALNLCMFRRGKTYARPTAGGRSMRCALSFLYLCCHCRCNVFGELARLCFEMLPCPAPPQKKRAYLSLAIFTFPYMQFYGSRFFRINIFNKIILTSRRKKKQTRRKAQHLPLATRERIQRKIPQESVRLLRSPIFGIYGTADFIFPRQLYVSPAEVGKFSKRPFQSR